MAAQLSVIMSAFNSSKTIERAINSILSQSFSDFELIVLNDGSTDETEEKILSYSDERIKYHPLGHSGLTGALNFGLSLAEAEIIVRHDSDDWSEPDRLARQMRSFREDGDLSLVSSWHNVVDVNGNYLGLKPTASDDRSLKKMLRWRNPFCHGTVAVRKSSLDQVGGYNEALLFSQDYDLWLRMAAGGMKFFCIPEPLYNYSITPESIARGWLKLGYAKKIRLNALLPEDQQSFAVAALPAVGTRRTDSLWYYALGSLALDDGRRGRALAFFLKSLLINPLLWHASLKIGAALLPAAAAKRVFNIVKKRM